MTASDEATTGDEGLADLVLRPAVEADVDALADLFVEARDAAYPAMPRPIHQPPAVKAWFREVLGLDPRTSPMPDDREAWVAVGKAMGQDGALLGYLVLDPEWLDSLYVRPELTGRGVGSVLLELAKGLRPAGFGLWVFESNVAAQRFYRRHGLVAVRRTDGSENEERSPDIEMAWLGTDGLAAVRRRIDAVDDRLADLLNERALLTAAAQELKPVAGQAGRDPAREAEIVARLAPRTPDLGEEAVARIVHEVISASLDALERRGDDEGT